MTGDATRWSLYGGALLLACNLLHKAEGNHLRWLGAADAFVAELDQRSPLARVAGAKVGGWAIRLAVVRGRHPTMTAGREAMLAELAAVKQALPRPSEAAREARSVLLRALAEGEAERIDAALWALAVTCGRAVLDTNLDKIHAGKAVGR